MIFRLYAIALNTFREAVRDRVLYNLVFFALLMVASAPLFSQISFDIERLVLLNVGLTSISLFGLVIAIFIGIGLVSKEIEKKTLYTILSRPVRRWEFIVGKYFGLVLTLVVNAAIMTVAFFGAIWFFNGRPRITDSGLLVAIYFIVLQFLIVTALTLLFSSFSTPIFSGVFSFSLFVIGTFAEDLRSLAASAHGAAHWLATGIAWLVPNFASLNVIGLAVHQQPIGAGLVLFNTCYALFYSAAMIAGAVLIFDRRNLK